MPEQKKITCDLSSLFVNIPIDSNKIPVYTRFHVYIQASLGTTILSCITITS